MVRIYSFILLILLVFTSSLTFAQEKTASSKDTSTYIKKYKKIYWGVYAGVGNLHFNNTLEQTEIGENSSISGGVFVEYHPIKHFAVEIGGEYLSLKSKASLGEYNATLNTLDNAGDAVAYRFSAANITETQNISLLNIPIALKGIAMAGNWEFYAKGGIVIRNSLSSTYSQSGTFTNNGYYKEWDLLITDLAKHGYYTDMQATEENDITWKTSLDPVIGGGIVIPVKALSFFIEANYFIKAANYFDNKQSSPFQSRINNTSAAQQKTGSLLESGSTTLNGFAVNIGVRF